MEKQIAEMRRKLTALEKFIQNKPPKMQAEARAEIEALRKRINAVEKALNQK